MSRGIGKLRAFFANCVGSSVGFRLFLMRIIRKHASWKRVMLRGGAHVYSELNRILHCY